MSRLAPLAVAAAAVLWAAGGTYARLLVDRGASVVELTEARAWIAASGFGIALLLARPPRAPKRPAVTAVVAFGLALAGANFTYYLAISILPVAVAIVIQYTAPGLVVLWRAVETRRSPGTPTMAALALALAGVFLLSDVYGADATRVSGVGVLIALASALCFAAYVVLGEKLGRAQGTRRAVTAGFVVAAVFWAVVQAIRGRPDTLFDARFLPGILFLGIAATIVPFYLFVWGLRSVGAAPAGITSTLEPVAGALFAFVLLGQTLTPVQLVGAAAVVGGIAIIQGQTRSPATSS